MRLTVSAIPSTGTAPSQPSPSADTTRSSTWSSTSGRAASCTSTTAASSGTWASAVRTESARLAPPVTVSATLPAATSSATRMHGSSQPGGAATTMPSIHSDASRRSSGSASSGRSFRDAKAFGRSRPSRSPAPAAARIAQTLTGDRDYSLRLGSDLLLGALPADTREDVVEPLRGLLFVHALRVHELGDEDLLGLDEHLLLARGEAFLVIAERQVADDLGELEDVAGLHLVAVVLEAAVPVLGHRRPAPAQRLQHLLDRGLVDDLAEADPVGVLGRHVDRHVVVENLNREVLAFLAQHLSLVFLDHGACSVVWIHDLIADLVQARPPRLCVFTKAAGSL